MKASLFSLTPFAAALLLGAIAPVQAQNANSSVRQAPRPAPTQGTAGAVNGSAASGTTLRGMPSPSGLASPSPFPAGMPPVASPVVRSLPPSAASPTGTVTSTSASGTIVTPAMDGTVLPAATTVGAGVAAGGTAAGTSAGAAAGATQTMGAGGGPSTAATVPSGPGPYTALQLSQSFLQADANRDGELTRTEAQRLTIMLQGFDEMDRNRDGVISRSEYEDGSR